MEDIVIVESRDYAQVVFECVDECYTETKPLECFFTLSQLLKVEPTDFIGIFKVGFTNLKEYVLMKPINVELLTKEKRGKLVFEGQQLPKEDGEYYQFVYVSQGRLIRGASIPFQFKRSRVPSYVCVEETIVYKPRETQSDEVMQMKLSELTHALKLIISERNLLSNQIISLKNETSEIRSKDLKMTIEAEEKKNQLVAELTHTLKMVVTERNSLNSQIVSLKQENVELKSSKVQLTKDLTMTKEAEEKNKQLVGEITQTLKMVVTERNHLNSQIATLKQENVELKSSKIQLTKDLTMTKEKLAVAEKTKETIKGQLAHVTRHLEEVSTVNKNDELVVRLREQERIHQQEKDHLIEIIKKIKEETKVEQLTGPYYALQVANTHLEKKINSTKQESTEQRQKIHELVEEIESLKDRLRQGAYEYTTLNRKYFRLMNLVEGSNEMVQPTIEKSTVKIQPTEYFSMNEYPSLNIKYEQHYPIPSCYKTTEIPRSQSIHKSWEPKTSSIQGVHIPSVNGQLRY